MHADDRHLILDTGERVGPFSSHWAACAAMIRRSNPTFRSLGGDKPDDLELEKALLCSDCPPVGYPTDKTRCSPCPRAEANNR